MSLNAIAKLHLEQVTYLLADQHMVGYNGGSWTWKKAGFWSPKVSGTVKLLNHLNGSEVEVKPLTAGYCLAVMACNKICWMMHSRGKDNVSRQWADHQYRLRDHALDTLDEVEASKFLEFID